MSDIVKFISPLARRNAAKANKDAKTDLMNNKEADEEIFFSARRCNSFTVMESLRLVRWERMRLAGFTHSAECFSTRHECNYKIIECFYNSK